MVVVVVAAELVVVVVVVVVVVAGVVVVVVVVSSLSPVQEWKRTHDLLDVSEEAEEPYAVHPLWELRARGLSCSELWRESVGKRFHINVLEAKSYIKEEKRCAVQSPRRRIPFARDSQVCLGSLIKGRSASVCLN